eukprot:2029407-Alexandrium_andersonii.AAC.1
MKSLVLRMVWRHPASSLASVQNNSGITAKAARVALPYLPQARCALAGSYGLSATSGEFGD